MRKKKNKPRIIRPSANRLVGWNEEDEEKYEACIRRTKKEMKREARLDREAHPVSIVDYRHYSRYERMPLSADL